MTTKLRTAVFLALLLTQHVAAAEPRVITLSCDGTQTHWFYGPRAGDPAAETPLRNVGLVVNLDERKVSFVNYVASITDISEANIDFSGRQPGMGTWKYQFSGNIDRVTGYMHMMVSATVNGEEQDRYFFDVRCKATERVF